jgi:hypothetical protein
MRVEHLVLFMYLCTYKPPFSMQATICSPHYYKHQMEVKEDLSDIWKEDPDYKFLNYIPRKKAWEGRERHELAGGTFF